MMSKKERSRDAYAKERSHAIKRYRSIEYLLNQIFDGRMKVSEGYYISLQEERRFLILEYNL